MKSRKFEQIPMIALYCGDGVEWFKGFLYFFFISANEIGHCCDHSSSSFYIPTYFTSPSTISKFSCMRYRIFYGTSSICPQLYWRQHFDLRHICREHTVVYVACYNAINVRCRLSTTITFEGDDSAHYMRMVLWQNGGIYDIRDKQTRS